MSPLGGTQSSPDRTVRSRSPEDSSSRSGAPLGPKISSTVGPEHLRRHPHRGRMRSLTVSVTGATRCIPAVSARFDQRLGRLSGLGRTKNRRRLEVCSPTAVATCRSGVVGPQALQRRAGGDEGSGRPLRGRRPRHSRPSRDGVGDRHRRRCRGLRRLRLPSAPPGHSDVQAARAVIPRGRATVQRLGICAWDWWAVPGMGRVRMVPLQRPAARDRCWAGSPASPSPRHQ